MSRSSRGLSAITRAREDRSQGRVRWTTQAGLLAAAAVVGGFVAHRLVSDHELRAGRQALLSKQRAVAATLGAEWLPLRDKLESEVLSAAGSFVGDAIDDSARRRDFRSQPGLYLRMRVADATGGAGIRAAAAESKKDAFAACLLREPYARSAPRSVAFAEQPWNLGQAYSATRILTDEWVRAVQEADDDMRLRVFVDQYNKAVRDEVPVAIDVVKRAEFFLLVLDEDVPEAAPFVAGGVPSEEALQLVAHPARIHLYELPAGREIVRLRRSGDALVIPAGERATTDPETHAAMQRQANNCALAARVEEALTGSRPAP